ncbi:transglycosylase SLT domain-containing protein [Vibrio gazogenes]|uniref:Soluble lytic murein transglycosylase n=1 Tax=Vibrio gazogenes DSM 21264 = NBRC 103151 TaxID=1123492 RepID=A0A1M5E4D4_VIBGA|nr:transglycosylase SLT domain-containing protein [Vibrio gazogenes]USP14344.1 transglycosylase SLT domain-containing protein [Vibrio gazogenes]SHF74055.1 soluble lytic murein transglycosylase [Vibrio gazogenes DSM 21264] [Vibrio gazogenes DSM 21264 = NBRC 103151]
MAKMLKSRFRGVRPIISFMNGSWSRVILPIVLGVFIGSGFVSRSFAQSDLTLAQQRQLYERAQLWLDQQEVKKYHRIRDQLLDYPLTPYLDYRSILVNIGDKPPLVIKNFIDSHRNFPFAGRISAPYLDALAQQKKWSVLLTYQKSTPKQEKYRCYYYTAMWHTGRKNQAYQGAESLWLSGDSVDDACDFLFSQWRKTRFFTDRQVIDRMFLAFEQRNFSLMKYLNRQLNTDQAHVQAQRLLDVYRHPKRVLTLMNENALSADDSKTAFLGLKKWAAAKPIAVYSLIAQHQLTLLTAEEQNHLALYVAKQLLDETSVSGMTKWRDQMIAESGDIQLIERRIRQEIRQGDWHHIHRWIGYLPESLQRLPQWQFWLGRSEIESGNEAEGINKLAALTELRSFYGVAASEILQQPFVYRTSTLSYNPDLIEPYQKALARIEELIEREKIAASKSEWHWLLQRVSVEERAMLARYAATAHWYHLAVVASIQAKLWANLDLRFPRAYLKWFEFFGNKNNVDPISLMSLARQESAMDIEAHSPVGAKGLMQIMPSTARHVAKKYRLQYHNASDLFNVEKNIELGSQYLHELLARYDGNRILAFAAYNAGPYRVDQWLKASDGELDVYRFIESIPFYETRGYVQNVLMFENYYRYLMGVKGDFLQHMEVETKY